MGRKRPPVWQLRPFGSLSPPSTVPTAGPIIGAEEKRVVFRSSQNVHRSYVPCPDRFVMHGRSARLSQMLTTRLQGRVNRVTSICFPWDLHAVLFLRLGAPISVMLFYRCLFYHLHRYSNPSADNCAGNCRLGALNPPPRHDFVAQPCQAGVPALVYPMI